MGGSKSRRTARHAETRALREISFKNFFSGLEAINLAPAFFGALQNPELAGTPLARGLQLQGQLFDVAQGGLRGEAFPIPGSVATATREGLTTQLGILGLEGSPSAATAAAERFTAISEQVRSARIGQALSILQGGGGGGSVFPSTSELLQLGAQRALARANVRLQSGGVKTQIAQQESEALGKLIGAGTSLAIGAATGGLGLLPGIAGGFGGALAGGAAFSGFAPPGLFGLQQQPQQQQFTPVQFGTFGGGLPVSPFPFGFPPQQGAQNPFLGQQ